MVWWRCAHFSLMTTDCEMLRHYLHSCILLLSILFVWAAVTSFCKWQAWIQSGKWQIYLSGVNMVVVCCHSVKRWEFSWSLISSCWCCISMPTFHQLCTHHWCTHFFHEDRLQWYHWRYVESDDTKRDNVEKYTTGSSIKDDTHEISRNCTLPHLFSSTLVATASPSPMVFAQLFPDRPRPILCKSALLHEVDDDAVIWLKLTATAALTKWIKWNWTVPSCQFLKSADNDTLRTSAYTETAPAPLPAFVLIMPNPPSAPSYGHPLWLASVLTC